MLRAQLEVNLQVLPHLKAVILPHLLDSLYQIRPELEWLPVISCVYPSICQRVLVAMATAMVAVAVEVGARAGRGPSRQ